MIRSTQSERPTPHGLGRFPYISVQRIHPQRSIVQEASLGEQSQVDGIGQAHVRQVRK